MANNINKIIVLDLGSESMFAICGDPNSGDYVEIDLQNVDKIRDWKGSIYKKSIIKDRNRFSKRLLNRVAIKSQLVEEYYFEGDLNDQHAQLRFDDSYRNSVFDYYHDFSATKYLVNPKIVFAKGSQRLLPELKHGVSGKSFTPKAATLIKHLMLQVINNLIVKSKECEAIEFKSTKIVLTFPNVYSQNHAQEITSFIKNKTAFNDVEYIYESDAAIYALIGAGGNTDDSTDSIWKKFSDIVIEEKKGNTSNKKNRIEELQKKIIKRPEDEQKFNEEIKNEEKKAIGYNVISVDVGKGTTDISLFSVSNESDIEVLARTGISKAGSSLDYIFVKYFEKIINARIDCAAIKLTGVGGNVNETAKMSINNALQKVILVLK